MPAPVRPWVTAGLCGPPKAQQLDPGLRRRAASFLNEPRGVRCPVAHAIKGSNACVQGQRLGRPGEALARAKP